MLTDSEKSVEEIGPNVGSAPWIRCSAPFGKKLAEFPARFAFAGRNIITSQRINLLTESH
jgi:hypothetical protein